jgi:hypothetical protein
MKRYANITAEDKLVHKQYKVLMKVIKAHGIEHKYQIAKMLDMSDSCWAHRCGGERLLMNIGELNVLAEKLDLTDEEIVKVVKGVTN